MTANYCQHGTSKKGCVACAIEEQTIKLIEAYLIQQNQKVPDKPSIVIFWAGMGVGLFFAGLVNFLIAALI